MRLRTLLKPLSFIPALLLMYMIFQFSAQEAETSSNLSYKVSYTIVSTADYVFDTGLDDYQISDYALRINGITRKLAHMTEYFLLAIAMSFPLYVYGLRGILLVIVAGGICVAYACTDEYHQSFVAGRAASYKDIGIDSFGVLVGIILVRIIGWTGRHTIFAPSPDERYEKMTRRQMKKYRKKQQQMEKELKSLKHEQQAHGPYPAQDPYRQGAGREPYPPQDSYRQGAGYEGYPPQDSYRQDAGREQYPPRDPYRQGAGYEQARDPYRPGNTHPYEGDPSRPVYYGRQYGQEPPADFYGDDPDDVSSDELSEDMPLSRLLKKR